MKKIAIKIAVVIVWAAAWTWTYGVSVADMDHEGSFSICKYAMQQHRENVRFILIWSAIPPNWIVAPLVTAGYRYR